MGKNYRIKVTERPARSRRKYNTEFGVLSGSSETSTAAEVPTGSTADGHSHDNLADLDRISIDGGGYGLISGENPEQPEKIKAGYADRANEAAHAAEADEAQHAASAAALDEDSPTREDFLSSKNDDTAEGLVKFLKGILTGAYEAGKAGAKLDADGNLEAAAALVRGLLRAWVL